MISKRHHAERGPTDAGWLKSLHSFSFGGYHDPSYMGFGVLRVINEDRVKPGAGFGTHPHSNMEIISYVLEGELAHKDSMGNGSSIRPGDVQLMSAGTGVTHSEFNDSPEREVHFLQIWIEPNARDTPPGYQQTSFAPAELENRLRLVVSPDGAEGSLRIRQDASMFSGRFEAGRQAVLPLRSGRKYWLQMVRGEAEVNGKAAAGGDGFALENERQLVLDVQAASEAILFDLPA